MKDVFATELADRSVRGRRAFSQKLLSEAGKYDANPVDKFVLLGGAIAAGEEGGDLRACFTAADQLAAAFQVDAQGVKADAALKMPPSAYASDPVENVKAGLELLDRLVSAEDFANAARLATLLQPFASGDDALNRQLQQRSKDINAMRLARDRSAAQLEKLKSAPYDPAANLEVGRYYCFVTERWDLGLPMLARGSDQVLKDLAASELAKPPSPDRLARLGDGWWDAAAKQAGISHDHVRRHAASLYAEARDGVSGLQRTLIEKRLAEVAAMEDQTGSKAGASPSTPDATVVILGERNAFWTNNLDAPIGKELATLQKGHTFRSVAFTPTGDWVALLEGNRYSTSNADLPACKKLTELQKGNTFQCAAFAPTGGWTVLWNQNGNWTDGGIPDEAFKKMQEVVKGGGTLRSIAFGPNGAWVVLFDKAGVWYGSVPDDLGKVLDNAVKKGLTVRCVCFTTSGTWICLTSNGWWTSDANHPASKMIAELDRKHQSLQWVAVAPETGPPLTEFWFTIGGDDKPGRRHWVRVAGGAWEERYDDGEVTRFEPAGTLTEDGNARELLRRVPNAQRPEVFQILIPPPVEGSFLECRYGDSGPWGKIAPIRLKE